MNRRGFLALLGLAAPAAVLAPNSLPESAPFPPMAHPTGVPFYDPPDPAGVIEHFELQEQHYRYLGIAQLKNEGAPVRYDPMGDNPWWEDQA